MRFIDFGAQPGLRTQAIYHGLAKARGEDTPDTIVLTTPSDPYVCIGYHQGLEREVDLEFCRRRGISVFRREVGGGAVYLDSDQLFVQWIMAPSRLPSRLEPRFELFTRPLIETYRELGVDAEFRPINDIHVHGRKICGTGAARIGTAEVMVGNFLFDFDTETMSRILAVSSTAMRNMIHASLDEYMSSMRRELGTKPDSETVSRIYLRQCEETLVRQLVAGSLNETETAAIEAAEEKLSSEEFLRQPGGLKRTGVKIHEDVWVTETTVDSIRVTARLRQGRLDDINLAIDSEDETPRIAKLERSLRNLELERDAVTAAVREYYDRDEAFEGRVGEADWVNAIMSLKLEKRHV